MAAGFLCKECDIFLKKWCYFETYRSPELLWEECYIFKGHSAYFDTILFLLLKLNCSFFLHTIAFFFYIVKYSIFEENSICLKECYHYKGKTGILHFRTQYTSQITQIVLKRNPTFTKIFLNKNIWLAQSNHRLVNNNNFWVEVDALKGTLHFFEEPHFFKALSAGNVAQAYNFIDYIQIFLFGQWKQVKTTALPDIVCNFAFSSMCCIFFGQLLRCAAQTHSTLLRTSTPVWKHQGVSLIF